MALKQYDVTIRTTADKLATILEVLLPASGTLMGIQPVEDAVTPLPPKRNFHYANGKKKKGLTGEQLALQIISSANRTFSVSEVSKQFEGAGFAATSAGPSLSTLARKGKARRVGDGMYCAIGTTLKLGAGSLISA